MSNASFLRQFIRATLSEGFWSTDAKGNRKWVGQDPVGEKKFGLGVPQTPFSLDQSELSAAEFKALTPKNKRGGSVTSTPTDVLNAGDASFAEKVQTYSTWPECASVDAYLEFIIDDEAPELDAETLIALAHNAFQNNGMADEALRDVDTSELSFAELLEIERGTSAFQQLTNDIKQEFTNLGVKFKGRVPPTNVRGFQAPAHGSNRYAGNAAGSGAMQGGHIGIGSGQGSMGAGKFDASSKSSLPMGAGKIRK